MSSGHKVRSSNGLLGTESATKLPYPEGPSTQHIRTLVPKTVKGMVFGTRVLEYWVLGPSGSFLNFQPSAPRPASGEACHFLVDMNQLLGSQGWIRRGSLAFEICYRKESLGGRRACQNLPLSLSEGHPYKSRLTPCPHFGRRSPGCCRGSSYRNRRCQSGEHKELDLVGLV